MANNTTLPGTGEIYASEERGGSVNYQKVLIEAATGDNASVDAFGKWRVSNPVTLFDSKLIHGDAQALLWDESLISGTMATSGPTVAKPFIDFTSTNVTAGRRVRQTFRRFNYQPGKSMQVLITGVLELASGTKTGCERRLGYYDDDNGVFFESDAGTIGVTIRTNDTSSPVDTTVTQANWNLDTMDGDNDAANPSGETLDITKAQIFVIDFQWLSVGRIRFGLEHEGHIHYVHESTAANVVNIPWASTPNLPVRYEIITTTSSGVCSMRCICSAVISEGGTNDNGLVHRTSTAGTAVTTTTEGTLYALVGLRLKSTHLGLTVKILETAVQIQTASEYLEWVLLFNPTVAGTFTFSNHANSGCQTAIGVATNTVTGGTEMGGGYTQTGNQGGLTGGGLIKNTLQLGAAIDDTVDEIVLAVRPIGGVSTLDVEGGLVWQEI